MTPARLAEIRAMLHHRDYVPADPRDVIRELLAEVERLRDVEDAAAGVSARMADLDKYAKLVAQYAGTRAERGYTIELSKAHEDVALFLVDLRAALNPDPRDDGTGY